MDTPDPEPVMPDLPGTVLLPVPVPQMMTAKGAAPLIEKEIG